MCMCLWCVVCMCVLERRCGYLKSVLVGDQGKRFSLIAEVLSCGVTLVDYYYPLLRERCPLPSHNVFYDKWTPLFKL